MVDVLTQCERVGELHHAIAAGLMTAADVRAELGAVVAGQAPGRRSAAEIVVFESTGTAMQDVAVAAAAYERAQAAGVGVEFDSRG